MENSVCVFGAECGSFNPHVCSNKNLLAGCGGKIKPNAPSAERFEALLPKEFLPGVCKICGAKKEVAAVNHDMNACRECWPFVLMKRPLRKERP